MIGRKIFYLKSNGQYVFDSGEREGFVLPTQPHVDFPDYNPAIHGILEVAFGERSAEFESRGSCEVQNGELLIYPRIALTLDKQTVAPNEVVTIVVTVEQTKADNVTMHVDGQAVTEPLTDGTAVFTFSSAVEGEYVLSFVSTVYGANTAVVEVV